MAEYLRPLPSTRPRFVCPWCGEGFGARHGQEKGDESLERHWIESPTCRANRNVNSPLQAKYDLREPEPDDGG